MTTRHPSRAFVRLAATALLVVGGLSGGSLAPSAAAQDDTPARAEARGADVIVAEIQGLKPPTLDSSRRNDEEYIADITRRHREPSRPESEAGGSAAAQG